MEYAIVDIETTGSYAGGNNITEIAIIIHNGTHILEKYQSLVKPTSAIPFHIQSLTGISNEMVEHAPSFHQIAAKVFALLTKRIFVAHNVNFDYPFVTQELKLAGYDWAAPKLCTVRLARKIIPNLASYSLGKLCQNLQIPNQARHRAMGDAEATAILFERLIRDDSENIIASTLHKTKAHKLPTHIDEEDIKQLPEATGVYLFKDKNGKIIYVGKGVNIKKRVLSHFTGTNNTQKKQSFLDDIYSIDVQETGTELMALLTECQLIKQHWPKHNTALKRFEPKFGLLQYEDQNGYIRLLISPYNKHAHIIQHFERATEGNQLLLQLIEEYNLESKLCFFYSVQEEAKAKVDYTNIPAVKLYNHRVVEALEQIKNKRNTFLIIDQGRAIEEKSYIYFKEDQLYAFGYIAVENQFDNIEDIITKSDRCTSNYYMTSLVLQYVERFPSKVFRKLNTNG